jgi:3-oxoacyl-[acyl-carrier protein] reductase
MATSIQVCRIGKEKRMPLVAILGATGSIGSQIARGLVERGQSVLLVGRNREKLAAFAGEIGQPWAAVDFASSAAVEEALRSAAEAQGGVHGIVNCVGSILLKPAHTTTDDEFRQMLETNLFSAFAAVRAAGKLMRTQGGAVVLFASAAADIGIQNHEAIAAAKGGVAALARSAAATYASSNIRVNAISPGLTKTELTRRIWENPASAGASEELHALGRLGEPADIAALALWLLDPNNNWITGQVIAVDGGLSRVLPRRRSS